MTGMRLTEASQLYVNDILEENGIAYIRVDKLNPHQKLKNRSSKRKIPIHPKLIELGFLKYVNSLKEQKIERVFHQLGVNKRGFGKPFGGKFRNQNFRNEWLNEKELEKNGETKVFHCFRHNFLTELEDYATPHKYASLAGHKMGNYKYVHPPLERLADAIYKMNYDEIDFSHLIEAVNNIYKD
jgi:integrase